MPQLDEIKAAQDNLEESFTRRMAELEAQLGQSGPAKETVSRVAEEFRAFRELMCSMLSLLRSQINECSALIDNMETRHRRKALIFLGVAEEEKEDCKSSMLKVLHKMDLKNMTTADFKACHRIGSASGSHHRPILVKFDSFDARSTVWRAKSKLRGSKVTVREFLTRTRQALFVRARQHFGMRGCWTQDGTIVVRAADGSRQKCTTSHELSSLMQQFPKASGVTSGGRTVTASTTGASAANKTRK